jgi:heterodisulfide reductase subunit C
VSADAPQAPPKEEKFPYLVEREYVDERRITEPESLESGGVDMSGRWGVLIAPRTITAFDHSILDEIRREPGGQHIQRCFQCGNCTGVCPVAEEDPRFNPRYFIHVARMGYAAELQKVREAIYQCESCGRCSEVCPRQVNPSGVMAAIGTVIRKPRR